MGLSIQSINNISKKDNITKLMILRGMKDDNTIKNRVKNKSILGKLDVALIDDKMTDGGLT